MSAEKITSVKIIFMPSNWIFSKLIHGMVHFIQLVKFLATEMLKQFSAGINGPQAM